MESLDGRQQRAFVISWAGNKSTDKSHVLRRWPWPQKYEVDQNSTELWQQNRR